MTTTARTLITAEELHDLVARGTPDLVIIDTRFDLVDTEAGERSWRAAHLPGSLYLHLERDLSAPKVDAGGVFRGRHPLPERRAFAELLGRCGIGPQTQVVALDAQGGSYAARLWWMLRWMGHADVAVLDGGIEAWKAVGGALVATVPPAGPELPPYPEREPLVATLDADALLHRLGTLAIVDARAAERFRGEVEPLDQVAGHIPGALNRFHKENLAADGRFKPPRQLRAEFGTLLGTRTPEAVVHQCGSGVTACHNLLAMEHAGLAGATLYPGSWSEWSSDPERPVAKG